VWLFTGIAVYVLIHQLSDVSRLAQQVRNADWRWLPAILAMSALSYVGLP
jgi:glycosyltransferase 2 family protein